MDSRWREILREHRYERYSLRSGCSCKQFGTTLEANEKKCFEEWLDHIEEIERQKPKTRGKGMEHFPVPDDDNDYENWRIGVGLPPQRSMTPEESANLAAYHKTKFKRVPEQDDGLREAASKLVAKLDLIHADERYKGIFSLAMLHGFQYTGPNYETELANLRAALASEKAAPEESK